MMMMLCFIWVLRILLVFNDDDDAVFYMGFKYLCSLLLLYAWVLSICPPPAFPSGMVTGVPAILSNREPGSEDLGFQGGYKIGRRRCFWVQSARSLCSSLGSLCTHRVYRARDLNWNMRYSHICPAMYLFGIYSVRILYKEAAILHFPAGLGS